MNSSSLEDPHKAHVHHASATRHVKRPRLVFLLAASHSGSTLLAMLLGAQAGACSVGELKATSIRDGNGYRCSCRSLIHECQFWKDITVAMANRGFADFNITKAGTSIHGVPSKYARRLLAPLHRGPILEFVRDAALSLSPTWLRYRRQVDERNRALIESLGELTKAKVVVDSSKLALRLKYLLRIPNLEIQVIRVIRDGRAVALTYVDYANFADARSPELRAGGTGAVVRKGKTMAEAAREWRRSNEAADSLVATLPLNAWTEVRYEQLCADPASTLKRLSRFLDLDASDVTLDFKNREHHVIGNGMRFDTTSKIELDDRWRTTLTDQDLETFEKVAGPLNHKYGYV